MDKDEKPHIELYMYSLNQEFPIGGGHQTFLKRHSELKQDLSGELVELAQIETQVFALDPQCVDPTIVEPRDPGGIDPSDPSDPSNPGIPKPGIPGNPEPDPRIVNPGDWNAQWVSNEWTNNHTKAVGNGRIFDQEHLATAIVREEKFGSIVFEPNSDRVYKLNGPGTKLFMDLQRNFLESSGKKMAFSENMIKDHNEELDNFVEKLKAVGLWARQ